MQPAPGVDRGRGGLRVVQVPLHYLGPADQDLTVLVGPSIFTALGIDDPALRAGHQLADRPGPGRTAFVRRRVGHRARLGEAVPLLDLAPQSPGARRLQGGLERRCAAKDRVQAGQIVLVDHRLPGQGEHERRDHERTRHAVRLQQPEEGLQLELGAGDERRPAPEAKTQHDGHPINMEER